MNKPYSKWFWRDHEQDLNLSACHPFAQGVWMRIQAIMAQGEPYGFLRMEPRTAKNPVPPPPPAGPRGGPRRGGAGGPPSGIPTGLGPGHQNGGPHGGLETQYTLPQNGSLEHQIFARCGVNKEQMEWVIAHLEEHHVFSRDDKGIIYSRRMVREDAEHRKRVETAIRARAAYERRRGNKPPDGPPGKGAAPSGKPVSSPRKNGPLNGVPSGGPPSGPHGGRAGVPGGPPISTTRSTDKTHPPDPPFAAQGGPTETPFRKPSKQQRLVAKATALALARSGGKS